ncbi:hypothetical protein ABI59_09070 [Acidobacteria bacterium Mor1]|nr:hypothetical protein ABI59_09070 [Acidobacteria bacterium Mor1]
MSPRRFDPYQQGLGVASAWLVAVLAVIAALMVRDFSAQNLLVRWGWWILVGVAILRALYRSHIYRKRSRSAQKRDHGHPA